MAADDLVRRVAADARVEDDPTPGMNRQRAFGNAGMWAGIVHTDAGATSGWHHHGEYETAIYVTEGRLRMECGPGGGHVLEADAGDFLHVPAGAIHRESNPGDVPSALVVVRAGQGIATINVDGPAA